mgnify:CR=1 FL=1
MNDSMRIYNHVRECERNRTEISDACARIIASQYSQGMGRSQVFASTGAIIEYPDDPCDGRGGRLSGTVLLWRELFPLDPIEWDVDTSTSANWMGSYLLNGCPDGSRGPIEGWASLWL